MKSLTDRGWSLPALLPVLVTLGEFAARGLPKKHSLWAFIAADLQNEGLTECVQSLSQHLKNDGGVLLLDGLDEVPEVHERREQLREAVLIFARDFPKTRIVVTSRPYAYQNPEWQLSGFSRNTLLDFSPDQIEEYIGRWYDVAAFLDPNLNEEQASQYAAQLKKQVKQNKNLRELAPRPLLLAQMVSLHRWQSGGLLPERREQLYNAAVDMLLERWQNRKELPDEEESVRQEKKSPLANLGIDLQTLRRALSRLAFEVHHAQPEDIDTADIPHEKLVAALRQAMRTMPKEKWVNVRDQDIAEYVRNRAGLLEDRGEDVYGFPHRTFQEYLAAMHLLDEESFPENIVELALNDHIRWREATLLAGNSTNTTQKWALIEQLYKREEPPHPGEGEMVKPDQWWGVFLAGQVLHDSGLINEETKIYARSRAQLQDWHKAILTTGALDPLDRADAGDLLAKLGDDRPGVLTCDAMQLCYVPPGDFWMADEEGSKEGRRLDILDKPYWLAQYPVTVAQFREFVHSNPDYKPDYGDISISSPNNGPVVYVNWYDALTFCEWLNRRWQAHLPPGYRVTLPNEAEWEKAARGGLVVPVAPHVTTVHALRKTMKSPPATEDNRLSEREYPWGDEPEKPGTIGDVYRANNKAAGVGRATAVGSFPAGGSRLGCLDMSGNVWEWTRSYSGKERPYRLSAEYETIDSRNQKRMLLCGGSSWNDYTGCSARVGYDPAYFFYVYYGFRVAVSPFVSDR